MAFTHQPTRAVTDVADLLLAAYYLLLTTDLLLAAVPPHGLALRGEYLPVHASHLVVCLVTRVGFEPTRPYST